MNDNRTGCTVTYACSQKLWTIIIDEKHFHMGRLLRKVAHSFQNDTVTKCLQNVLYSICFYINMGSIYDHCPDVLWVDLVLNEE